MSNEEDFDDNGYRWECQGCADKFGISADQYREIADCDRCEYAKMFVKGETNE